VGEGLLEVERHPDDHRATVLTLTDSGRTFLLERLRVHRATLRAVTDDFTPQERTELVRLLDKLAANKRGTYQGLIGAVFGVSSVAGPLLGGFFTDGPGCGWGPPSSWAL
jgi:hypothetical protein